MITINIQYLPNYNGTIFEIIANKTNDSLLFHTISINPLTQFIKNREDIDLLQQSISEYFDSLNTLNIDNNFSDEVIIGQDYFVFGAIDGGNNSISFAYSDIFNLNDEKLNVAQNSSVQLAKILVSLINKNQDNIMICLEEKMEEIIKYEYTPLEDGNTEVFAVILVPDENNTPSLTVRYFGDPNHQSNIDATIIESMFDKLVPIIFNKLNISSFFMIKEPITIIKLGLSTKGDYNLNTNTALIRTLSDNEICDIKNILISTYEVL